MSDPTDQLPNDPRDLVSAETRARVDNELARMAATRRRAEVDARDLAVGTAETPTVSWYVGDRVEVAPDGRQLVTGTVSGVDQGGVNVDLDEEASGALVCYATHGELTRVDD